MYILGYLYYLNRTLTRQTPHLPVASGPSLLARAGAAARAGLTAWKRDRTRRAVSRELSALSDLSLKDIGLERNLIVQAADRIVAKAEREAAIARRARGAERTAGAHKVRAPAARPLGCG